MILEKSATFGVQSIYGVQFKNLLSHTTHTEAEVAIIVIGRIDVRRVEEEEVGAARTRVRPR